MLWKGAYLICDGGYIFVDPTLMDYEHHTVSSAEWLESVRKDVERLFGALKMRFRWISKAIEYQNIETLGYAVAVAAILHNRLLAYDNFDKFNWKTMDPSRNDFEDEKTKEEKIEIGPDKEVQDVEPTVQDLPGHQELSATVTDLAVDLPVHVAVMPKNRLGYQMEEVEEVEELPNPIAEVQQGVLKDALRKHFSYAYSNGQIHWPKRFTHFQKQATMPLLMVTFSILLCN